MKKFKLGIILLTFFASTSLYSQEKDLEILQEQNDNIILLVAKNNSTTKTLRVELDLKATGYKVTKRPPYDVVVKPQSRTEIVHLIAKSNEDKSISFNVKYIVLESPNMGQTLIRDYKNPNPETVKIHPESLALYTKQSCARCSTLKEILKDQNITFKEYKLESEESVTLLWTKLNTKGVNVNTVNTPVIEMMDRILYKLDDIDMFIKGVKKSSLSVAPN
jgi:glutaredoxin